MKGSLILSFVVLFLILSNATEVNFKFASMIPSNSVSCNACKESCGDPAEQIQSSIIGDVVGLSSDPAEYDQLLAVWQTPRNNSRSVPTVIVLPKIETDVVTAINYARINYLEVSVKNGGHSQDGLSLTQRGLQINFQYMKNVVIDAVTKTALVEPGTTNTDVNNAGKPFKLAHVGGDVGSIGFSGATSVGAYGALSRMKGLGIDNVLSVKIVTYEGKVVNVSQKSDPDLFWAVRGSLSNFGVAVLWQIQLHEVGSWYGGNIVYGPNSIGAVLKWAHQYVDMEHFFFRSMYLVGDGVYVTQWAHWDPSFTNQEKDAFFEPLQDVAPFFVWTVGLLDYYQAQAASDASVAASTRNLYRAYGVGGGVVNPSPQFFDKFQELCLGLALTEGDCRFEMWGGNISAVDPGTTAYWSRKAQYVWTFEPNWFSSAEDKSWIEKATQAYQTLRAFPEASDDCYPNYVSPDFASVCYGGNVERLRSLKAKYDPDNFFHRNYNIQP